MNSSLIEIWKPITDFEGQYEVSSFGRVKSLAKYVNSKNGSKAFRPERIVKLCFDLDGYHIITLHSAGKRKTIRVHRLVANAFLPNPKNKEQVNHIDRIKVNNYISNLEWVSNRENAIHRFESDGYAHVGVLKKTRCYTAKISVNRKTLHLGCFKTVTQAKEAYLYAKNNLSG